MSTRSSVGFGVVEHAAAETPINSDESRAGREQAAALRRLQKIWAIRPQSMPTANRSSFICRRRFQPRGFLVRPMNQLLALVGGEPGFGVQQGVFGGRHVLVTHLFADPLQPFCRAFGQCPRPVGKIHVFSTVFDIAGHQPRHRRDVAVPRPFGFVGMTVVTGRVQQGGDLRWRRVGGHQIMPRRDRRVRARRVRELQQCKHHDERGENPFQPFQFSLHPIQSDAEAIGQVRVPCKLETIHGLLVRKLPAFIFPGSFYAVGQ